MGRQTMKREREPNHKKVIKATTFQVSPSHHETMAPESYIDNNPSIPSRLVIVAGTYDGVLAGWDTVEHVREQDKNDIELKLLRRNDGKYLKLSFAMAAHEGSVRCLDISGAASVSSSSSDRNGQDDSSKKAKKRQRKQVDGDPDDAPPEPGTLLSGGFDETINVFNLQKHCQAGELKSPNDLGSPLCCSFAPPCSSSSGAPTHALVGLTSGKVVLYKKRDWSVQHVLAGHDEGGVQCLAVHPTGKMALTGGRDGKVCLWDLMKGRLAFVYKIPSRSKVRKETVNDIVWCDDGTRYAFCYGSKITARDVASGEDLLDVDMPSRVNQIAFIGGPEGLFLAAGCDDGGLPVLEVGQLEEEEDANTRRAIMAIEPVDRVVAGDDRLKCIRSVEGGSGFLVVTANSGGIVSLMDLEGAARMMLSDIDEDESTSNNNKSSESEGDSSDSDVDSDDEVEVAVEILDSVRLGSGARITDVSVWSCGMDDFNSDNEEEEEYEEEEEEVKEEPKISKAERGKKFERSQPQKSNGKIELDAAAVEKARKLVGQAKKKQRKQKKKKAA
jgi:protein MAK11